MTYEEMIKLLAQGQCIYGVQPILKNELTIHQERSQSGLGVLSWDKGASFFVENATHVEKYEVIQATNGRTIYRIDHTTVVKNDCYENSKVSKKHLIIHGKSNVRKNVKRFFKEMKNFITTGYNETEEYTEFTKILGI